MKVAILKERDEGESRVAASPESVKKLMGIGLNVVVEPGAGARAHFSDDQYRGAGADVAAHADGALAEADVLLTVGRPSRGERFAAAPGGVADRHACALWGPGRHRSLRRVRYRCLRHGS